MNGKAHVDPQTIVEKYTELKVNPTTQSYIYRDADGDLFVHPITLLYAMESNTSLDVLVGLEIQLIRSKVWFYLHREYDTIFLFGLKDALEQKSPSLQLTPKIISKRNPNWVDGYKIGLELRKLLSL